MRRVAIGLIWTFTLLWAGNFAAFYAGIPPIATGSIAIAIGAVIAIDPRRRMRSTTETGHTKPATRHKNSAERLAGM